MEATKELPKKVKDKTDNYLRILNFGEEFTVDDVCEATDFTDKKHLDNYLCGICFKTSAIERNGDYFIKKRYSDVELKSLVKNTIYRYGYLQPNVFLEGLNSVTKERLEKILEKGCTKDGWIKKVSNGEIIYFR